MKPPRRRFSRRPGYMLLGLLWLVAVGGAAAPGATAAGAAPPAEPNPDVQVGDTWTIRTLDGFTNEPRNEATQRVVELNEKEIVVEARNLKSDKVGLRYFNREWNVLDNGEIRYEPFYPEYRFPMTVGLAWQSDYTTTATNGDLRSAHVSAKVSAFEKVEVPAGTFDAYRIERTWESRGTDAAATVASGKITTWYAPAAKRFVRREMVTYREGRIRDKSVEVVTAFKVGGTPAATSTRESL